MTARDPAATDPSAGAGCQESKPDSRWPAWLLAILGICGATAAVIGVGILHVLPQTAGVDQVRRTISEYALTDLGWVFNLSVLALALGSLAILGALVLTGRARAGSLAVALGLLWSAALLVVVVFPKHNWAVGPSTNGSIHRVASIVAFLCLPFGVLLLTRRTRSTGTRVRQAQPARIAFWLAVLSLGWFGVLLGAWALTPLTGTPWWQAVPLGLVERGLVISEVLAVIALGCWAFWSARPSSPGFSAETPSRHPLPASRAPSGPAT